MRGSRPPLTRDPWLNSPYTLVVGRADQQLRCQVWRAYFDRPLPPLPIPLSAPDADLKLELQPLIDTVYDLSRYGRTIDSRRSLSPPLTDEEKKWFETRFQEWQEK